MRFILFIFLASVALNAYPQVLINEIMSSNNSSITDVDGEHHDWIEIYNNYSEPINLYDYSLSDNDANPLQWKFPEYFIEPGEFIIVFASGKDRNWHGYELHTNFRISRNGEPVILSNNEGILLDRFPPVAIEPNLSFGRYPDASDNLVIFAKPSPGESNSGQNIPPVNISLSFSHSPGYYDYDFLLQITSDENTEIRYTIDAGKVSDSSFLYNSAIKIDSRAGNPNYYSEIPTAEPDFWLPPLSEVPKIHVIRARPYINGIPAGPEIYGSFWTGHHDPKKISLPIVSLISDPKNLYDYHSGISVPGASYDTGLQSNAHRRGRVWEREAYFSYFDEKGQEQVSQKVGIRAHGGATRRYRQKTFRLYARESYGKEYIEYPFFEDRENKKFKRLLLNTTMGDWSATLFKDELATTIVKDLNLDYLAFKTVITFVNGEYWGIQYVKERRDNYYIAQNYNIPHDNIDRLSVNLKVESGSRQHYNEMLRYIDNNNPEHPDTYAEIKKFMDVDNYIDYKCMQIFFNNRDWPHNNVECWRHDTVGGRWRWMFLDLDGGLRAYHEDNLSPFLNENAPMEDYKVWGYELMLRLMKIPGFRNDFTRKFNYHLKNTVSPDKIIDAVHQFKQNLLPYVHDHINRWQFPSSIYEWEENLSVITSFAMLRPAVMLDLLNTNSLKSVSVFPNPAREFFYIEFTGTSVEKPEIEMYKLNGQKIITGKAEAYGEKRVKINTSNLQSGMYIVQIKTDGFISVEKIIIFRDE